MIGICGVIYIDPTQSHNESPLTSNPCEIMRDNTKLQYLKYALVSSLLLIATFTLAPARADQRDDFLAGRTRDCRRCDLAGLNFKRRDLSGADLTGANLRRANLHEIKLDGAVFRATAMPDGSTRDE